MTGSASWATRWASAMARRSSGRPTTADRATIINISAAGIGALVAEPSRDEVRGAYSAEAWAEFDTHIHMAVVHPQASPPASWKTA